MAIKIIKPGIFTTIQDPGRTGYRSAGIGPGGTMDFFAASAANILVDNSKNDPVIEMHYPAPELLLEDNALLSITGADFGAYINDNPAPLWAPVWVKRNDRLYFKKWHDGARAYLSFHGAIKSDSWLNSFSTHTRIRAGGHMGRPLLKDDVIELNAKSLAGSVKKFPKIAGIISDTYQPSGIVRCIAGPEWRLLDNESKNIFVQLPFTITTQSDRMGYRLKGVPIGLQQSLQLISSPVDYGTIQLLPTGQLIVLMADHQTSGGYPRIATVIGADLPKLAQSPVHKEIRFELTDIAGAEENLFLLHQTLEKITNISKDYFEAN